MSRIRLTWANASTTIVEQRVYRSTAPLDIDDMPAPLAVLPRRSREYLDSTIEDGLTYYYAVSSVLPDYSELFSDGIKVEATPGESDPHWDKVVALLHFDGDLNDETGRAWESVGSSVVSSDESVFGGSSLKVPTTTGLVRAADSADFDFGSGDFTIEFFLRPTSVTPWASYVDKRESGAFHAPFMIQRNSSANTILFRSAYAPESWSVSITATHPPGNMWTHVVYQRREGVFQAFLGGVQVGSFNGGSNSLLTNNATLNIGATGSNSDGMVGYIDELRITKGVARYTENFTPPTEPFPNN